MTPPPVCARCGRDIQSVARAINECQKCGNLREFSAHLNLRGEFLPPNYKWRAYHGFKHTHAYVAPKSEEAGK